MLSNLAKAMIEYTQMVEKKKFKLEKYECDSVTIPYDSLKPERRSDDYLLAVYKQCLDEQKPWQELIKLDYSDVPDFI